MISFTTNLLAQERTEQVQRITKHAPAPYDGWCLTDQAMAIIIADKEQSEAKCNLKLQKLEETIKAKHSLEVGNLKIQLNSLQVEYEEVIKIKNHEIQKLEGIALKKPNNYWYLFAGGGFVAGVITTVGIVFLISK